MRLVAIVLAWALDALAPDLAGRRIALLARAWEAIGERARATARRHPLLAAPGAAAAVALAVALASAIASLLGFVLAAGALWLCLGPRSLERDVESYLGAQLAAPDDMRAASRAGFVTRVAATEEDRQRDVLAGIALASYRRRFAPLFWFALLGVFGAVLYRLGDLARDPRSGVARLEGVLRLMDLLDWAPGRLYALLLGVGGSLPPVWRHVQAYGTRLVAVEPLIGQAALAAAEQGPPMRAETAHAHDVQALFDLQRRACGFAGGLLLLVWLALD